MRALISALILCISTVVSATTLNKFVVFGDSLSDNGNLYEYLKHQLPMSPPYYDGRFTNGPVWIESLIGSYYPASSTKEHFLDYAFGGAPLEDVDGDTLFTLRSQLDNYFLTHQNSADANSLYVIWIGSNDYLNLPEDLNGYNAEETVQPIMASMHRSLKRLVDNGAKHILILNLPDLGRTPIARDFAAETELSASSTRHNELLLADVEAFKVSNPDVQWLYFDIRSALDEMLTSPAQFGFTNVTDTCYEAASEEPSVHTVLNMVSSIRVGKVGLHKNACDGFLFFDPVHPSQAAHRLLAKRVRNLLDEADVHFE